MSLVKCKDCGKEVSTEAKKCVNCGSPIKKRHPWGVLLFILILAYFVNAFYIEPANTKLRADNGASVNTVGKASAKVNVEKMIIKGRIAVFGRDDVIRPKSMHDDYWAEGGKKFVCFKVTVVNESNTNFYATPGDFTLIDNAGGAHNYASETHGMRENFASANLQPNTKTGGWILFQVNESASPATLVYSNVRGGNVRISVK